MLASVCGEGAFIFYFEIIFHAREKVVALKTAFPFWFTLYREEIIYWIFLCCIISVQLYIRLFSFFILGVLIYEVWSSENPLFSPSCQNKQIFHVVVTRFEGKRHPSSNYVASFPFFSFPILFKKWPKMETNRCSQALVSVPRARVRHHVRSTHVGDNHLLFCALKHTDTISVSNLVHTWLFYTGILGAIAGAQSCGIKKKKRLFFSPDPDWPLTFKGLHRSVSRQLERSRCIFNVLTLDVACFFGGSYYFCVWILLKKKKKIK